MSRIDLPATAGKLSQARWTSSGKRAFPTRPSFSGSPWAILGLESFRALIFPRPGSRHSFRVRPGGLGCVFGEVADGPLSGEAAVVTAASSLDFLEEQRFLSLLIEVLIRLPDGIGQMLGLQVLIPLSRPGVGMAHQFSQHPVAHPRSRSPLLRTCAAWCRRLPARRSHQARRPTFFRSFLIFGNGWHSPSTASLLRFRKPRNPRGVGFRFSGRSG